MAIGRTAAALYRGRGAARRNTEAARDNAEEKDNPHARENFKSRVNKRHPPSPPRSLQRAAAAVCCRHTQPARDIPPPAPLARAAAAAGQPGARPAAEISTRRRPALKISACHLSRLGGAPSSLPASQAPDRCVRVTAPPVPPGTHLGKCAAFGERGCGASNEGEEAAAGKMQIQTQPPRRISVRCWYVSPTTAEVRKDLLVAHCWI